MATDDVQSLYQDRLREAQTGFGRSRLHLAATTVALVVAAVVCAVLGLSAAHQRISWLWPIALVPVVLLSGRLCDRYRQAYSRTARLARFYDRAIQRVQGQWARNGIDGKAFDDPEHAYTRDLNIFGPGSLFEFLCIARSGVGQQGLAKYLLEAPSPAETLARQQAVRELRERTTLREEVALLGRFEFIDSNWETFSSWLDSPPVSFPGYLRPLFLATSIPLATGVVIAMVLLGLRADIGSIPHIFPMLQCFVALALFQALDGWMFQRRVTQVSESVGLLSVETQVIREGLRLLEKQRFQSVKLTALVAKVRGSASSLRELEQLLIVLQGRNKDWYYLPSRVLMIGTQASLAIEHWRAEHGTALRDWLGAWAEFEALIALAGYAYENPDAVFPEISEGPARFEARDLGHPLLPNQSCVRNDISMGPESRFYIVSGSNMAGKSTLLRAIGVNAVLAFAGAPVRARALRLSPLSVCPSLAVVDSLLDGKSKFLAEVQRLRRALESAGAIQAKSASRFAGGPRPVLFLIDEILGGTNSRDRRVAAEAVARALLERGAIGLISTHDLALTEIADQEGLNGVNVHMGCRDGGGPMDFDYLLKPGVTTETNALAIARMAGVLDHLTITK